MRGSTTQEWHGGLHLAIDVKGDVHTLWQEKMRDGPRNVPIFSFRLRHIPLGVSDGGIAMGSRVIEKFSYVPKTGRQAETSEDAEADGGENSGLNPRQENVRAAVGEISPGGEPAPLEDVRKAFVAKYNLGTPVGRHGKERSTEMISPKLASSEFTQNGEEFVIRQP
jgi:hypothetical protein